MTIKKFITDLFVGVTISFASMIGIFAGITVWASGLGDWVEKKTSQLFNH